MGNVQLKKNDARYFCLRAGGLVAREMKISGNIGTKIATKALKDCDRVEVDANKGIVRKL